MSTSNEIENPRREKRGRTEDLADELQEAFYRFEEKAEHSRVEVEDIRDIREAITGLEELFRQFKEALHAHGRAPPPGFHRQEEWWASLKERTQRLEDTIRINGLVEEMLASSRRKGLALEAERRNFVSKVLFYSKVFRRVLVVICCSILFYRDICRFRL